MKRYDVRIAVWIAVAIMTYEKYHEVAKKRKPDLSDFYFRQMDIVARAEVMAKGKVHRARVSQWYNGDDENSVYNYLRAEGPLRRLTQSGEFNGKKEAPEDLRLANVLETDEGIIEVKDLMHFLKTIYYTIDSKMKEEKIKYSKNRNKTVGNEPKTKEENREKEQSGEEKDNTDKGKLSDESIPLASHLEEFSALIKDDEVHIYNEFSFKFELGVHLKNVLPPEYQVEFERRVDNFGMNRTEIVKNRMAIVIFNSKKTDKYCIELKYPVNKQVPLAMYRIVEDFKFLEQLKENDFTGCFQITLIISEEFKAGETKSGIYEYFRTDTPIHGEITIPTEGNDKKINISGYYQMFWENMGNGRDLSIVRV